MSDNLKGIALMVLAMLGLACTDSIVKLMAAYMPAPQVILILGGTTAAIFCAAALGRGEPVFSRAFFHPAVVGRSLSEAVASITITLAIALAPLTTVSALMQMNPILVTLGAALFFGEKSRLAALVGRGCRHGRDADDRPPRHGGLRPGLSRRRRRRRGPLRA